MRMRDNEPLRVALLYVAFGVVWIVLTDLTVGALFATERNLAAAQTIKGLAYIGVTALLVFWLARRAIDHSRDRWMRTQLHSTHELLHKVLAGIGEAVIIVKPGERTIQECNLAAERMFGYTASEFIGLHTAALHIDEASHDRFLESSQQVLSAGEVFRATCGFRHRNGSVLQCEVTLAQLSEFEHSEWSNAVLAIVRDVSERAQLEEQMRQAQRLETLGQLTGGIAHDFNNLLTVIQGSSELLVEQLQGEPAKRSLAEMISAAAERGAELTHRLLAFARRQPLTPQRVEVNSLILGMRDMLGRTLGEHIAIELVLGEDIWPALIDPAQLEGALLNLCINARDAMPGGGRLTLETANIELDDERARRLGEVEPGAYVLISVADTGTGIAREHLPRVFEPFFTTKEKAKGTGLGLAMVYGFIKQSNAHVAIFSEPGLGTTLKLYLPRLTGADPGEEQLAAPAPERKATETILLVEDDELVRRFAHDQLVALGYRILEAASGPEALERLRGGEHIDLLFTDMIMPGGMTGEQLALAARQIRPGLKVLYATGYAENAVFRQGQLFPGSPLLSKPYRRGELAGKVRTALARQVTPS